MSSVDIGQRSTVVLPLKEPLYLQNGYTSNSKHRFKITPLLNQLLNTLSWDFHSSIPSSNFRIALLSIIQRTINYKPNVSIRISALYITFTGSKLKEISTASFFLRH